MRYFVTSNASRPYKAGGYEFSFESVSQIGGSWLGVAAVEDDSIAAILAGAGFPQVTEVTQAEYEDQKKKPPTLLQSSSVRPAHQAPHPLNQVELDAAVVEKGSMFSFPVKAVAAPPAPVQASTGTLAYAEIAITDELLMAGDVAPRKAA